ncbi:MULTISPECIES: dCTP deaminase domain-containing protein [Acinetobacter]|uniref:dCTP deaminase n=1 Tax=Acinetobacter TaxID=469 RepID=UPI00141BE130|nr:MULTISPECIES: deoxycytidine deaminase [Acinetobacter]MCS4298404.1 deoxycytidine triphosphate deaminase [Acinetobacter guillouiae]MCW2252008.1 deoxycytidine triphosphate deaminase [Acinetobacter sp. BIGb0204]NII38661.1 deoxycytidine triphosphate deaminase [Acinetobacter sp. BIGb0196]
MILSSAEFLEFFIEKEYITNVNQRDLIATEGVGLDLSLSELFQINEESGELLIDVRRTPSSKPVELNKENIYVLEPGCAYLARTIEEFNLPQNLACSFFPRSTLFRSGILFESAVLSTGYNGPMVFGLYNMNSKPFYIQKNARFAQVIFQEVMGNVNGYKGQWQLGRISQSIYEKQI